MIDFIELNPTSPILLLLETLNSKKTLPLETLPVTLRNMGEYLNCVPIEAGISTAIWAPVLQGIDSLFRRLVLVLNSLENPDYLLNIIVAVLKIPSVPKVQYIKSMIFNFLLLLKWITFFNRLFWIHFLKLSLIASNIQLYSIKFCMIFAV